jgi:hypothetical protein
MSTKVYDAIMEEVKSGTFTPDALKLMDKALSTVKELEGQVKTLTERCSNLSASLREWESKEGAIKANIDDLTRRKADLDKREVLVGDADKRVAVAEARADVRAEVFNTIFRNVTVRRNVQSSIPIPGSNGSYPTNMSGSENAETIQE